MHSMTVPYDTIRNRILSGYYILDKTSEYNDELNELVSKAIDIGNVVLKANKDNKYDVIYGSKILANIKDVCGPGMDNRTWTIIILSEEEAKRYIAYIESSKKIVKNTMDNHIHIRRRIEK